MPGTQYLNILVGSLETPHVIYLYDCQPLKCSPNSNIIAQALDDAVRKLGINKSFFCLLRSDASKYMIAAGITLKSLHPKLFYVTCVAHLLHNCPMKIKSHFEDVNQLIAKIKAVTIKNKTRQAKSSAVGYPPQPAEVESSRTSLASRTSSRTHFQVLGLGLGLEASSPWPWPRSLRSSKIALSSARGQHYF